jgi:hypothetical protein
MNRCTFSKIIALLIVAFFSIFMQAFVVSAHTTGSSWEQVYNEYKVDVGYDPTIFVANEPERLDFNVVKEATGEDVPFADVWVRISKGNKTVFATGVHKPSLGKTGMTFTFPEAGDYLLSARFEKDGNTVVESSFPVTVGAAQDTSNNAQTSRAVGVWLWLGWGLAACSLCALLFLAVKHKNT